MKKLALLVTIIISFAVQNCGNVNSDSKNDENMDVMRENYVQLLLPDTVYMNASDTTEYNIDYDNCICVPNYLNYYFDVDCEVGNSFA